MHPCRWPSTLGGGLDLLIMVLKYGSGRGSEYCHKGNGHNGVVILGAGGASGRYIFLKVKWACTL